MPYSLRMPKRLHKELDALPDSVLQRIERALNDLRNTPHPAGVKKLKRVANTYRVRVGEYHILYEVDDASQELSA